MYYKYSYFTGKDSWGSGGLSDLLNFGRRAGIHTNIGVIQRQWSKGSGLNHYLYDL